MSHDSASTGATASRRTVLRTAMHAAWAVPVIQVAAQAPAFAGSGVTALNLTSATYGWSGVNLQLAATAAYVDKQAPQHLVFTFTLPASSDIYATVTMQEPPGADWRATITGGVNQPVVVSVVRVTPVLTSPVSLSLKVHIKPKERPGAITVTATASNMSQSSRVATTA